MADARAVFVDDAKEIVLGDIEKAFDAETAAAVGKAVGACIKNEQGSPGMYAEAYWCIFLRHETPASVIANFKHRLLCVNPIKVGNQ